MPAPMMPAPMTVIRCTGGVRASAETAAPEDGRGPLSFFALSCKKKMRSKFLHVSVWANSTMASRSRARDSWMDLEMPPVTTSKAFGMAG